MINKPDEQLQTGDNEQHPGMQFLIFAAILVGALIFGNLIGGGIVAAIYGTKPLLAMVSMDVTTPHFANALWIIQITGTTFPIFITPVFFSYVVVKTPQDYIKPSFRIPWVLMLLVLAIMLSSSPLIEFLSNINEKFNLPQWMRDDENAAQKLTDVMLQMNTVWNLIADVLIIGLLTAIAEEFMFRGVVQTIFMRWTNNQHAAVWITAILFSAFHMEFFGFLPRLLLGAMFGYFVVWTGSIWPAVLAHFINNATDVILTYLSQHKKISINLDAPQIFNNTAYIFSFIIVLFFVLDLPRHCTKKNKGAAIMEKNWVRIYKSTNFYQSEIVKQMLIQHHIEAVLMNKQDSSIRSFGNIEVYVHQQEFNNAIELLILNQIDL